MNVIVRALLLNSVVLVVSGPAGAQQAQYAPPLFLPLPAEPAPVDYARYYPTVEDCLARVARTRAAASVNAAVETARACGARFTKLDSAPSADLSLLQELFLYADQGKLALDVLARRLTLLPNDSSGLSEARLDTLQEAWRFALHPGRPAFHAWAEALLEEVERRGWGWRLERLTGYREFLSHAARRPPYDDRAGPVDTTLADHYASAIMALYDSLPKAERVSNSLARSIAVGALLHHQVRALARGEVDPLEPFAVWAARLGPRLRGEPVAVDSTLLLEAPPPPAVAPPLTADIWFNRPDSTTPRPTRGRLALVVFVERLSQESCMPCRLHERFGAPLAQALEITVVTHTHAYFPDDTWSAQRLTSAEEIGLIRKSLYEDLRLPSTVALAIEVTPFAYLPAPDRRMDDRPPANAVAYRPGGLLELKTPTDTVRPLAFGVDRRGRAHQGGDFFLVAPDGKVIMRSDHGRHFPLEAVLSGWLARASTSNSSRKVQ